MLQELMDCYPGFYITEPVGNNAFSFESRQCRKIYVPPLISGDLRDVCIGENPVFCEIRENQEHACAGLESFVFWQWQGKDVFIFDNHQHAFAFWAFALKAQIFRSESVLVHVDQHKDMRKPEKYLPQDFWAGQSMAEICAYVHQDLNVGNFIDPALHSGMFGEVKMIDHEAAFEQPVEEACVADIDLDIFAPEMDYIPFDKKMVFLRQLLKSACFITIATSPYFIDQQRAFGFLNEIFMAQ